MKIQNNIEAFVQWFETSHRVHEITMGDGQSKFYPQKKIAWLVWRPIIDTDWARPKPHKFNTLVDANVFLSKRQTEITTRTKRKTIVKKTNHPFNLVFEKLKQTND